MELVAEVGFSKSKPESTHINYNVKFTSRLYDEHVKRVIVKNPLVDQLMYKNMIRKILYLNMTRPDISYSVQRVWKFLQQLKRSYLDYELRVIQYLKK